MWLKLRLLCIQSRNQVICFYLNMFALFVFPIYYLKLIVTNLERLFNCYATLKVILPNPSLFLQKKFNYRQTHEAVSSTSHTDAAILAPVNKYKCRIIPCLIYFNN